MYSSFKNKTIDTAEIIVQELKYYGKDLGIKFDNRLNEVDRLHGEYIDSHENFQKAVYRRFSNLNLSINNWETSMNALHRISSLYEDLINKYKNDDFSVGLVSHGTILSLFLGYKGNF